MKILKSLYKQFSRPRGPLGWIAGTIMSLRSSNRLRNDWTVDNLGIEDGSTLLEIGFGPGLAIQKILASFPRCVVTGIDHSEVMLRMATKNNQAAVNRGQAKLFCAGVDSLKGYGSFDRIYALNSHMFWPNLNATLEEIAAHLNKGGILGITYQSRGSGASDEKSISEATRLSQAMKQAGLVNVRASKLELSPVVCCVLGEKA